MPHILTSKDWEDLLSDATMQRSDLARRVDKAEMRVVSHYREDAAVAGTPLVFDGTFGEDHSPGVVQLRGWEEDSGGNPDTAAMPDDLVRRLRIVISDIVEWRLDREGHEQFSRKSEGSRSVTYDNDAPSVPTRLFQPLDKYDQTEPFSGRW